MDKYYIIEQGKLTAHKFWVFWFITKVCAKLMRRALVHDTSKYTWQEASVFASTKGKLGLTPYATPEYTALLKEVQPALDHHYANNSHHPEYYPDGFAGMTTLDKIEMVCDVAAAVKRTKDGNVWVSIEKNQGRFGYSDDDKKWIKSLMEEIVKEDVN